MQILEFPSDILIVLGRCLPLRDLNALIQANRHLALLLTPILYQRAIKEDDGASLMTWGVRKGDENLVEILVNKYQVDVSVKDERQQNTPLHTAADEGQDGVARVLLELGAHVDARNKCSETPLHVSARKGQLEVCKVLLANGADVNATTKMSASRSKEAFEEELDRLRNAGNINLGLISPRAARELGRALLLLDEFHLREQAR